MMMIVNATRHCFSTRHRNTTARLLLPSFCLYNQIIAQIYILRWKNLIHFNPLNCCLLPCTSSLVVVSLVSFCVFTSQTFVFKNFQKELFTFSRHTLVKLFHQFSSHQHFISFSDKKINNLTALLCSRKIHATRERFEFFKLSSSQTFKFLQTFAFKPNYPRNSYVVEVKQRESKTFTSNQEMKKHNRKIPRDIRIQTFSHWWFYLHWFHSFMLFAFCLLPKALALTHFFAEAFFPFLFVVLWWLFHVFVLHPFCVDTSRSWKLSMKIACVCWKLFDQH